MDGVLFDSMPYHAEAWYQTFQHFGIKSFTLYDAYLNEGRTGDSTINEFFISEKGYMPSIEERHRIYDFKSECFHRYPEAKPIGGICEVLQLLKQKGIAIGLVTGSAQVSLLERLNSNFPEVFSSERMVTAYDVKYGKPHPEPYLMGLERVGFPADNTLVVENAPLGVRSAVAAGISTIAVNTGILHDSDLSAEGSIAVLPDMYALRQIFERVL